MISILLISFALSMDAFSLSISLGTTNIIEDNKKLYLLFITLMHGLFPFLGLLLGNIIISYIHININIFLILLYIIVGTLMLIEEDNNKINNYTVLTLLILAFSVSFDSFSIGLGLKYISRYTKTSLLLFGLTSGIFSYIGLNLGKSFKESYEKCANIVGATILYILAIVNIIKYFH